MALSNTSFYQVSPHRNAARIVGGAPPVNYLGVGISLDSWEHGDVQDNSLDLPAFDQFLVTSSKRLKFFNNTNPVGKIIQALNLDTNSREDDLMTRIVDAQTFAFV